MNESNPIQPVRAASPEPIPGRPDAAPASRILRRHVRITMVWIVTLACAAGALFFAFSMQVSYQANSWITLNGGETFQSNTLATHRRASTSSTPQTVHAIDGPKDVAFQVSASTFEYSIFSFPGPSLITRHEFAAEYVDTHGRPTPVKGSPYEPAILAAAPALLGRPISAIGSSHEIRWGGLIGAFAASALLAGLLTTPVVCLWRLHRYRRLQAAHRRGACLKCFYPSLMTDGRCPECGTCWEPARSLPPA